MLTLLLHLQTLVAVVVELVVMEPHKLEQAALAVRA
jgi:hypothetical protein